MITQIRDSSKFISVLTRIAPFKDGLVLQARTCTLSNHANEQVRSLLLPGDSSPSNCRTRQASLWKHRKAINLTLRNICFSYNFPPHDSKISPAILKSPLPHLWLSPDLGCGLSINWTWMQSFVATSMINIDIHSPSKKPSTVLSCSSSMTQNSVSSL